MTPHKRPAGQLRNFIKYFPIHVFSLPRCLALAEDRSEVINPEKAAALQMCRPGEGPGPRPRGVRGRTARGAQGGFHLRGKSLKYEIYSTHRNKIKTSLTMEIIFI